MHRDTGSAWPQYRDEVQQRLADNPRDAVLFVLLTLKDVPAAWQLAHTLDLRDERVWSDLVKAYETIDPAAARRLDRMRTLAAGTPQAAEVDTLIADLRHEHRHRPRLQQEFTRVGLT